MEKEIEIYCKELTHVTMEAEKPCDAPAVSWQAGGVVLVQVQRKAQEPGEAVL